MKKIIIFAFFTTYFTVVLFRFGEFHMNKMEALIRAISIVVFASCIYYFQVVEKNWVFIRQRLIKNFGHLSGILVHTLISTAIYVLSLTVIIIAVVSKDMKEFLPLLILNTIFFSSNVYTKKTLVDKALVEGNPLDMNGDTIYDGCNLKYWEPNSETFVTIGKNWWPNENGSEIHFRTGVKKENIETRPLYEFMVI